MLTPIHNGKITFIDAKQGGPRTYSAEFSENGTWKVSREDVKGMSPTARSASAVKDFFQRGCSLQTEANVLSAQINKQTNIDTKHSLAAIEEYFREESTSNLASGKDVLCAISGLDDNKLTLSQARIRNELADFQCANKTHLAATCYYRDHPEIAFHGENFNTKGFCAYLKKNGFSASINHEMLASIKYAGNGEIHFGVNKSNKNLFHNSVNLLGCHAKRQQINFATAEWSKPEPSSNETDSGWESDYWPSDMEESIEVDQEIRTTSKYPTTMENEARRQVDDLAMRVPMGGADTVQIFCLGSGSTAAKGAKGAPYTFLKLKEEYATDSSSVIDGPGATFGENFTKNIFQGLENLLENLPKGEDKIWNISLTGHSRGACEAIAINNLFLELVDNKFDLNSIPNDLKKYITPKMRAAAHELSSSAPEGINISLTLVDPVSGPRDNWLFARDGFSEIDYIKEDLSKNTAGLKHQTNIVTCSDDSKKIFDIHIPVVNDYVTIHVPTRHSQVDRYPNGQLKQPSKSIFNAAKGLILGNGPVGSLGQGSADAFYTIAALSLGTEKAQIAVTDIDLDRETQYKAPSQNRFGPNIRREVLETSVSVPYRDEERVEE
jgi:hypothetical protein